MVTLQTFAKDRLPLLSKPAVQQPAAPPPAVPVKSKRTHVVQSGENLWKIARKYKVSIDALKKANRLDTDKLRPGKELVIP
jgi:LysM repeat protein